MLQRIMEKHLEKKTGRNFGPPGMKKLIYFIDDMNMPAIDTYGTVQPHTLIRQHIDYNHWYVLEIFNMCFDTVLYTICLIDFTSALK